MEDGSFPYVGFAVKGSFFYGIFEFDVAAIPFVIFGDFFKSDNGEEFHVAMGMSGAVEVGAHLGLGVLFLDFRYGGVIDFADGRFAIGIGYKVGIINRK
jgi:hypothetical protein